MSVRKIGGATHVTHRMRWPKTLLEAQNRRMRFFERLRSATSAEWRALVNLADTGVEQPDHVGI